MASRYGRSVFTSAWLMRRLLASRASASMRFASSHGRRRGFPPVPPPLPRAFPCPRSARHWTPGRSNSSGCTTCSRRISNFRCRNRLKRVERLGWVVPEIRQNHEASAFLEKRVALAQRVADARRGSRFRPLRVRSPDCADAAACRPAEGNVSAYLRTAPARLCRLDESSGRRARRRFWRQGRISIARPVPA